MTGSSRKFRGEELHNYYVLFTGHYKDDQSISTRWERHVASMTQIKKCVQTFSGEYERKRRFENNIKTLLKQIGNENDSYRSETFGFHY